ncbi:hypothetical protein [Methylobacterium pseudosasicola]|uniref:hypothetical protein n=1 Tax=Methylobacterium pseudosasicola TaxID=582667 RepID=UPI000B85AE15|nr:hypothetical protein [Methylobacterium pseudosasicola]
MPSEEAKTAAADAVTAQAARSGDARLAGRWRHGALRRGTLRDGGQPALESGAQAEPRARSQQRDRSQADNPHPVCS